MLPGISRRNNMTETLQDQPPVIARQPRKKSIFSSIWKFVSSVKLTLFILIVAALTSIIGTVVEQNKTSAEYVRAHGETWAKIIDLLQFDNMYHSPWFTAILLLLVLNIIACTYVRFPPKWRTLLKKHTSFEPSIIDKLSSKETIEFSTGVDSAKEKVLRVLKKKRYKVKINEAGISGASIHMSKGLIGRFGSDVVHISLLVILFGSIIGSYWGFKDFIPIMLNTTVPVKGADFVLRLDKFWIEYYDTGQIRQYNSVLTVVEDGKDVLQKQIWVNEPLYYKGIRFYQSSYGNSWNMVREAEIVLRDLDKGQDKNISVTVEWNKSKAIPGTDYSVRLIGYAADFAFDDTSATVYSKSAEASNPAVQVVLEKNGKAIFTPWLFFNYPGFYSAIPNTRNDLVLGGFRPIPYSGLSVNKDPGVNTVWMGCMIMGVGFILAFFIFHKRIWVNIIPTDSGCCVKIGGMTNKNPLGFQREFKQIVEALGGDSAGPCSEDNA